MSLKRSMETRLDYLKKKSMKSYHLGIISNSPDAYYVCKTITEKPEEPKEPKEPKEPDSIMPSNTILNVIRSSAIRDLQNQTGSTSTNSPNSDLRSDKAKEYDNKKKLEKELKTGSIETPTHARLRKKIGTIGISTCLGIIAYDKITKKTLLTHIDTLTDFVEVMQLLNRIDNPQIVIIGIQTMNYKKLISHIQSIYPTIIDMKMTFSGDRNVIFNPINGEILTENIKIDQFKKHPKFEINILQLQINMFSNNKKINLYGIDGYSDNYTKIYYTSEELQFSDKFNHNDNPYPVVYGYCHECDKIVNKGDIHYFKCSTVKKCDECGQRIDLGEQTFHSGKCSQSKPESENIFMPNNYNVITFDKTKYNTKSDTFYMSELMKCADVLEKSIFGNLLILENTDTLEEYTDTSEKNTNTQEVNTNTQEVD